MVGLIDPNPTPPKQQPDRQPRENWWKGMVTNPIQVKRPAQGEILTSLSCFENLLTLPQECSRLAFAKKGRSLQASDLTYEVFEAYNNLFEGSGPKL